jgi:hypothetical protein
MIKPDTIAISWFTKLPPLDREVSKNILLFPVSHRERLMSAQDLITITDSVVAGSGKIGVIVTKNHAWIVKFFFKRNEPTDAAKQLKDTLKKICTAIDDKENKNSFVFVQLKRHESRAGTRESITTEIQADICEYDGDIKDVFIEEAHKCSRAHPSARICAATDGTLISKEKIKGIIPQLHAIAQFAPGPSRYGAYQTRWILATDIDLQLAARFHEHQMRCAQKQWDYISEWLKYNPISFHNSHSYSRTAPEIGAGVVEAGGRMSYPELEIQAAKAQQQLHLHNHLTVEAISMAPEIPAVMLTQAFTEDVTRRYMFERYA